MGVSINKGESIFICIPMHDACNDVWMKLLEQYFSSKDAKSRGFWVETLEFLQEYLDGGGKDRNGNMDYNIASFVVPWLMVVLIILVFIGWFIVDGVSSSLVSRKTIWVFLVDRKRNRFMTNAFLTKYVVKDNSNNTFQFLTCIGNILCIKTISFIVGCVNIILLIFGIYWFHLTLRMIVLNHPLYL